MITPETVLTYLRSVHRDIGEEGGCAYLTVLRVAQRVGRRKVVSKANLELTKQTMVLFIGQSHAHLAKHVGWHLLIGRDDDPDRFVCYSDAPNSEYAKVVDDRCKDARRDGHPVTIRWIGRGAWAKVDIYPPKWAGWGHQMLCTLGWREAPRSHGLHALDLAWYPPLPQPKAAPEASRLVSHHGEAPT